MLINVKMPTIVGILTFMSRINFVLSLVEPELSFITSGPGFPIRWCYCKATSLFLNQNICYGYSKEPSNRDGSFEHQKHMLRLMVKKIIPILHLEYLLI